MAIGDDLWAYWTFGETEEPWLDSADAGPNGYNWVESDGYDPDASIIRTTGVCGNGLYFPSTAATDAGAQIAGSSWPDDLDLVQDEDEDGHFTLAFWFKHHNIGTLSSGTWTGIYFDYYMMEAFIEIAAGNHNAKVYASTFSSPNPGGHYLGSDGYDYAVDQWHLVVFYFDGNGIYLYVDNVLVDSITTTDNKIRYLYPDSFSMSAPYPKEKYSVIVDEMLLWKRALTSVERSWLWNGGAGRCNILTPTGRAGDFMPVLLRLLAH